jgi:iron complex outermembrane receptor protein
MADAILGFWGAVHTGAGQQRVNHQSTTLFLMSRIVPAIAALSFSATLPTPVYAQEPSAGVLEEILVTARKREENLQEVPIAITAFSEADIKAAGFVNLDDIARQAPGLQFNSTLGSLRPGRLSSNIRFRGIGGAGIGGGFGALQTANLFVDGVFVLEAAQSLALTDIERIEVIRGPQSAMFGRNTFAGAINYITKTPSMDEFIGSLSVDAGQFEQYEASFSVEGPLIEDRLAARLSARLYNKGPMYTASDRGDLGAQSTESVSLSLDARPTDALNFRFRAYYQVDDDGPVATAFLKFTGEDTGNDTCTGTSYQGYDPDGNFTTLFPTGFWCGVVPSPGDPRAPRVDANTSLLPQFPSFRGDLDGDGRDNSTFLIDHLFSGGGLSGVPNKDGLGIKREVVRVSLAGEYSFDNGITAIATAAFNKNDAAAIRDFDTTAIESFWATNPQTGEDKSIEIRAESPGDQRLRWMGGVNFYEQEFLTSNAAGDIVHVCGNFAGIPDNFCDFPIFLAVGLDGGDFVDVWSVFSSFSYDFTDRLTVDVEARYQEDKRGDGISNVSTTFKDFIPRVSLTYKLTDSVSVYGMYSQGVLPGVTNSAYNTCSDVPLTQPFIDPFTGNPSFATECEQWVAQLGDDLKSATDTQTLDAFEIGLKALWLDGRFLTNISVYSYDWNAQPFGVNAQVVRDSNRDGIPNANPNFLFAGIEGDSESIGVELESEFLVTENWSVALNVAYNDNEYNEFYIRSSFNDAARLGTDNLKGTRSSRFPEWSGNFSTSYKRALTSGWDLIARGDVTYTGEVFTGTGNLASIDDFTLVNGRVGIEKQGLHLSVYVKNLFDEDRWSGGTNFIDHTVISNTGFDFTNGGILLIPQDKRTFGITARYSF